MTAKILKFFQSAYRMQTNPPIFAYKNFVKHITWKQRDPQYIFTLTVHPAEIPVPAVGVLF